MPGLPIPFFLKADGNDVSFSIVVSRGCSSTSKVTFPFFKLNTIGSISFLKKPEFCAKIFFKY